MPHAPSRIVDARQEPAIDAAISKTIHVPGGYPREAFAEIGVEAWRAGLKGITTRRAGASAGAVLGDAAAARRP